MENVEVWLYILIALVVVGAVLWLRRIENTRRAAPQERLVRKDLRRGANTITRSSLLEIIRVVIRGHDPRCVFDATPEQMADEVWDQLPQGFSNDEMVDLLSQVINSHEKECPRRERADADFYAAHAKRESA